MFLKYSIGTDSARAAKSKPHPLRITLKNNYRIIVASYKTVNQRGMTFHKHMARHLALQSPELHAERTFPSLTSCSRSRQRNCRRCAITVHSTDSREDSAAIARHS